MLLVDGAVVFKNPNSFHEAASAGREQIERQLVGPFGRLKTRAAIRYTEI